MSAHRSRVTRIIGGDPEGTGILQVNRDPDNLPFGTPGRRDGVLWNAAPDGGATDDVGRGMVQDTLTLSMGRRSAGERFDTLTVSWTYVVSSDADLTRVRPGDALYLTYTGVTKDWLEAAGIPNAGLFRPRALVTDQQLSMVKTVDALGEPVRVPVCTVTATGLLGRGGQVLVGDVPWAQETTETRLGRILQAARTALGSSTAAPFYASYSLITSGPSMGLVGARDVDRRAFTELMQDTADSVGALLFESTRGPLVVEALDGRRNRAPAATIDAEGIDASSIGWTKDLGGLVNKMTVSYGPPDARAEVTFADSESIALYGEYSASLDSQLVDAGAALNLAALTVGRNSRPRWSISSLRVNLLDKGLDRATAAQLALVDVGTLVEVVGLPATVPTARFLYVEGLTITTTKDDWWLTLDLSAAGRTGAPLRWSDADPHATWSSSTADDNGEVLSWLAAAAWFNEPPLDGVYRWIDLPVDARWWHFAAGESRDPDHSTAVPTWTTYPDNP